MEKFNTIVSSIFGLTGEISDELTSKDIPNWDSMNYLLFIAELEKQFNITFDMSEVLEAKSLGDIRRSIKTKGITL